MENAAIYCTSHVLIRHGNVWKNGEHVLHKPALSANEFLRTCYDLAGATYPKFFKMDSLCKLAWVGAELLLQDTNLNQKYMPEEKGIILQNSSSSLDTDIKHSESISSADAYFPSPAVFVYTLPNIAAGEICIRQQIKGSSAFFIFEALDADFLYQQAATYLDAGRVKACIIGITEWINDQYETCLFLVEKTSESNITFTPEFIKTVYTTS